jgi:hypothetical protein
LDVFRSQRVGTQSLRMTRRLLTIVSLPDAQSTTEELRDCIADFHTVCIYKQVKLNAFKNEVFWFRTSANLLRLLCDDVQVTIGLTSIQPATAACSLGAFFDAELIDVQSRRLIAQIRFCHLRRLHTVRQIGRDAAAQIILMFVF